jgi:hypothetical protein
VKSREVTSKRNIIKNFNIRVDSRSPKAAGTREKEQEEGGRKKFGPKR